MTYTHSLGLKRWTNVSRKASNPLITINTYVLISYVWIDLIVKLKGLRKDNSLEVEEDGNRST